MQTRAFRGKIDSAHLPEVAVAELVSRAWTGAWRLREPKARGSEWVARSLPSVFLVYLLRTEVLMTEVYGEKICSG